MFKSHFNIRLIMVKVVKDDSGFLWLCMYKIIFIASGIHRVDDIG